MGHTKQLLLLGGKPLVFQTTAVACQADLGEVLVITGSEGTNVAKAVKSLPVRVINNPHWRQGQATSVRAGVEALNCQTQAVIFLPADQPLVTPELLRDLVLLYHGSGALAVMPCCHGQKGSPVLFDLSYWRQELLQISGDKGGRDLLKSQPNQVAFLEIADDQVLFDADTPTDFKRLQQLWCQRQEADPRCE